MAVGSLAVHYLRIGGAVGDVGEIKFGFRAPDDSYDGIADELGVTKLSDNNDARGIAFGINTPRPPKVRLSGIDPQPGADIRRSAVRFCDADKVGRVLNGSLRNATCKTRGGEFNINNVSMA